MRIDSEDYRVRDRTGHLCACFYRRRTVSCTYVLPSSAPGMNALFLAWAFALLAVMTAISNVRAEKHR